MGILNGFGNCQSDLLASAQDQCSVKDFGDLIGFGISQPNVKIPVATVNDRTSWETLVKNSRYFPYLGLFNFEQTTPENEVATSSTGLNQTIRDGKPSFTITFPASTCLVKSLNNKKGLTWRIVLYFDKGIYIANDATKENVFGFLAPYFDVSTMRFKAGTDIQQVNVMFQLEDANEFNMNGSFITYEALGFNLREIQGAFNAELAVEASAGTSVLVTATALCNSDVVYEGLELPANWKVNGVATTAVSYSPATGKYTLTVATLTAGDNVVVSLAGEDELGNIYVGTSKTIVSA